MHWTYEQFDSDSDLQQGDIIARDGLVEILAPVLNYFCDPRYIAFLVVSQSCDLVMRGGECKASHLSLAVVRELDQVLPDLIRDTGGFQSTSLFVEERRLDCERLIERIINQNEQSRGFFYFHPDADVGIAVAAVAFLRVTISLKAEHYPKIRQARVGRLATEFANKLGWLTGNLYSRVGTSDWSEVNSSGGKQIIDQCLGRCAPRERWIPQRYLNAAFAAGCDFSEVAEEPEPLTQLMPYAGPSTSDNVEKDILSQGIKLIKSELISNFVVELEPVADAFGDKRIVPAFSKTPSLTSDIKALLVGMLAKMKADVAMADLVKAFQFPDALMNRLAETLNECAQEAGISTSVSHGQLSQVIRATFSQYLQSQQVDLKMSIISKLAPRVAKGRSWPNP